jgi:hypothetical protein
MYLQYQFTQDLMGSETSISGTISSNIFRYNFENAFLTIDVLNTPLIMYISFTLLSVFAAVLALKNPPIRQKFLQEVVIYNVMISILFIASSIVLMVLLPDTVSGVIDYGLIAMKFPIQGGEIVSVFNFTYIFMIVYIILNIVALQLTKEKKYKEKKEETDLDSEFLL